MKTSDEPTPAHKLYEGEFDKPSAYKVIEPPELSEWQCFMWGSTNDNGLIWRPKKGDHPNWFWRRMQFLCFGNRWEKIDE